MALVNSSALVKSASSFTQVASVSSSSLPSSEEESVWYPGSESVAPSGIVGPLRAVSVLSSAVCWDFLSDEGPSPAISTTSEGVALKNTDNKSLQESISWPWWGMPTTLMETDVGPYVLTYCETMLPASKHETIKRNHSRHASHTGSCLSP